MGKNSYIIKKELNLLDLSEIISKKRYLNNKLENIIESYKEFIFRYSDGSESDSESIEFIDKISSNLNIIRMNEQDKDFKIKKLTEILENIIDEHNINILDYIDLSDKFSDEKINKINKFFKRKKKIKDLSNLNPNTNPKN